MAKKIIYYVNPYDKYYTNSNNDYYIMGEIEVLELQPIKHQPYIYDNNTKSYKKYVPYIYKDGRYQRVQTYVYTGINIAVAGQAIVDIMRAGKETAT